MHVIRNFINAPVKSPKQLGIILIILAGLVFAPQVSPNDWQLNTRDLSSGLDIYIINDSFVYPPWALSVLFVYYMITATGARILGGLSIFLLAQRRNWSLGHFLAIVANPFFIFAMLFSNIDLLVFLLPLIVWEITSDKKRWGIIGQAFALLLLMTKPQGSIFIIPFLIYKERARWQRLIYVFSTLFIFVVPISLVGNPPLIEQWLDNILNPSLENLQYWSENNISLTDHSGIFVAILATVLVFGGLFILYKQLNRHWTHDHSYTSLFLSAMLISPYTSSQSIIPPLAFSPSGIATILHYVITFTSGQSDLFARYAPYWIMLFGVIALLFSQTDQKGKDVNLQSDEIVNSPPKN